MFACKGQGQNWIPVTFKHLGSTALKTYRVEKGQYWMGSGMKAPLILKCIYRFWSNIDCHPDNVFYRDISAYFSQTMQCKSYLVCVSTVWFCSKSESTKLACWQSRPVSHWKCLPQYEVHNRQWRPRSVEPLKSYNKQEVDRI